MRAMLRCMARLSYREVRAGMKSISRLILAVAPERRAEIVKHYHDNGIELRNLLRIADELNIQLPDDVLDTVETWIADRTLIASAPGVDLSGAAQVLAKQRAAAPTV